MQPAWNIKVPPPPCHMKKRSGKGSSDRKHAYWKSIPYTDSQLIVRSLYHPCVWTNFLKAFLTKHTVDNACFSNWLMNAKDGWRSTSSSRIKILTSKFLCRFTRKRRFWIIWVFPTDAIHGRYSDKVRGRIKKQRANTWRAVGSNEMA